VGIWMRTRDSTARTCSAGRALVPHADERRHSTGAMIAGPEVMVAPAGGGAGATVVGGYRAGDPLVTNRSVSSGITFPTTSFLKCGVER